MILTIHVFLCWSAKRANHFGKWLAIWQFCMENGQRPVVIFKSAYIVYSCTLCSASYVFCLCYFFLLGMRFTLNNIKKKQHKQYSILLKLNNYSSSIVHAWVA